MMSFVHVFAKAFPLIWLHAQVVHGLQMNSQVHIPPDHCDSVQNDVFPIFHSSAECRENKKWYSYLSELYGSSVHEDKFYPIDISKFFVVFEDRLAKSELWENLNKRKVGGCPVKSYDLYDCLTRGGKGCLWDLPHANYIHHCSKEEIFGQNLSLPSHSLVEVSHCKADRESAGVGTWMYREPGSGMFYNLGNTRSYDSHAAAMKDILGIECNGNSECDGDGGAPVGAYHMLMEAAGKKGIDSIQFTDHYDMFCGHTAIEIVDVQSNGNHLFKNIGCGLGGNLPCDCAEEPNQSGRTCLRCKAMDFDRLAFKRNPSKDLSFLVQAAWKDTCNTELARAPGNADKYTYDRNLNANDVSDRLNKLAIERGTFGKRLHAKAINADEVETCLEFSSTATMCEIAPYQDSFRLKKACKARASCHSFNLQNIHSFIDLQKQKVHMDHCSISASGHTMRCNSSALNEENHIKFDHTAERQDKYAVDRRALSLLEKEFGKAHAGGKFLAWAIGECSTVDVHGMGMFSNGNGDFMIQHHYDKQFADSCNHPCWKGDEMLEVSNPAQDQAFWRQNWAKLCTPNEECSNEPKLVALSEIQDTFFVKSELELHLFHAMGIINWVWY